MANILSAELLAAQEDVSRHPIIEVKAGQFKDDLPLLGDYLNTETFDQDNSTTLMHSSGRIITCYSEQTDGGYNNALKLVYTDTERLMFQYFTLLDAPSSDAFSDLVLVEQADASLALFYVQKSGSTYYVRCMTFLYDGSSIVVNTITSTSSVVTALSALRKDSGYLISYAKDLSLTVTASGTYTGTSDDVFYTEILTDGSATTATFKWRKGSGAWSSAITMTGGNQVLSDGMSIKFATNSYWAGQTYNIPVSAARFATGAVTCQNLPTDGQTVAIGLKTYTWRNALSSPAIANEVKIDVLGREICMENLRCAVMAGTFEGTGAGVRYGTGTAVNPSATAVRTERTLNLTAILSGTSGNSLTLTVDGTNLTKTAFSGGLAAVTGDIVWLKGNKAYKATATTIAGTWNIDVEMIIGGINESRRKIESALFKTANGEILYFFSYMSAGDSSSNSYVYNILYSRSLDGGVNWGDAIALTSYIDASAVGRRPCVAQRVGGQVVLGFDMVRASRLIDNSNPYWKAISGYGAKWVHFSDATRKLYIGIGNNDGGNKYLAGILRLDVDSWAIDRFWSANTVPSLPPSLFSGNTVHCTLFAGDGDVLCFGDGSTRAIGILDGVANTLRTFCFDDSHASAGYPKNVTNAPTWNFKAVTLDAENHLFYVEFSYLHTLYCSVNIGSIDYLADSASFTSIGTATADDGVAWGFNTSLRIDKTHGYIMSNEVYGQVAWNLKGGTGIWMLDGSGMVKTLNYSAERPLYPYIGLGRSIIIGDWMYSPQYTYITDFGQELYYGIYAINLVTWAEKWIVPSAVMTAPASLGRNGFVASSDTLFMVYNGVLTYNVETDRWGAINNSTAAGTFPTGIKEYEGWLAYDAQQDLLYFGESPLLNWRGVVCFPASGKLEQTNYMVGEEVNGTWGFSEPTPLISGNRDYNCAILVEPSADAIYAFWTHWTKETSGQLFWDNESGTLDLSSYLVRGQAITQTRAIDGSVGTFSFSVSHGHYFDATNTASLLSRYLKKGKKILVRYGQEINGANYWQNGQSVYVLTSKRLTYKREEYPIMEVECEDIRTWWDEQNIVATGFFSGTAPSTLVADILTNYAGMAQTAFDASSLDNLAGVYIQYLDTSVKDVIDAVCSRFGKFVTVNLDDNKVIFRDISANNVVDHAYNNNATLLSWSPDDAYSSFTNRVTVIGESRYELEVITDEESLGTRSGTLGFFCNKQVDKVYFSEDHEKRARNLRLGVTQSLASIGFRLAGKMKTTITASDPEGHWVEVTSSGPNLIPLFLTGLALIYAGKFAATPWDTATKHNLLSAGVIICLEVLASIGNFSYEIYGNPIGEVKQTIQSTANDTEFQQELRGIIVENRIEDELCYDTGQCLEVANRELWIVQAQRNRIKMDKLAHLQDDVGDTITLPHPFTGATIKLFITNLSRTMVIPSTEGDDGEFKDEIEGWVI